MPSHMCSGCSQNEFKFDFAAPQLNPRDNRWFCTTCEKVLSNGGRCREFLGKCRRWQPQSEFDTAAWNARSHRICKHCAETRHCRGCEAFRSKAEFITNEWQMAGKFLTRQGKSIDCCKRNQATKICSVCEESFPQEGNFTKKMWMQGDDKTKCIECCRGAASATECSKCKKESGRDHFLDFQWKLGEKKRVCLKCGAGKFGRKVLDVPR